MTMRMGERVLVLVVAAITVAVGCKTLKSGAQEKFSERYSCPKSRVTVRERPDVTPLSLGNQTPPSDVASDPERLAEWKKNQRKKAAAVAKMCDVFEAEGCGHKAQFCCSYPSQNGRAGRVMCKQLKP